MRLTGVAAIALTILLWPCAVLCEGQPRLHHAIATRSAAAQRAFDRGLTLVYAFNFLAAEAEFRRAVALDPAAPMPWWGLALAMGPNYNAPQPSVAAERAASDALGRARVLAAELPPSREKQEEEGYIAALTLRFDCAPRPNFPGLEEAYSQAMAALAAKFPGDPDAPTLQAAAMLQTRSWQVRDGAPGATPDASAILSVLEGVLRRWPDHIGANHFYIHAAEASTDPSRALASAQRLDDLRTEHGFPGDGHLLHMPAHIYLRTGMYKAAAASALAAASADQAYMAERPDDIGYETGYALHNLAFLVYAAGMDGDLDTALQTATQLAQDARKAEPERPSVAMYEIAPMAVMVRFGKWDEILALSQPNGKPVLTAYWHYARACAAAERGNLPLSLLEMQRLRSELDSRELLGGALSLSHTTLRNLMVYAVMGRVAAARHDYTLAARQWTSAVQAEDQIGYREPPVWNPAREPLGAAYLAAGRNGDAEQAFRACLAQWPGDPRALFGLAQALTREGKGAQAKRMLAKFRASWSGTAIRLEDL